MHQHASHPEMNRNTKSLNAHRPVGSDKLNHSFPAAYVMSS